MSCEAHRVHAGCHWQSRLVSASFRGHDAFSDQPLSFCHRQAVSESLALDHWLLHVVECIDVQLRLK